MGGNGVTPHWRFRSQVAAALLFSYGIEFSQFYHADWIDSIRASTIGGLVQGFGFPSVIWWPTRWASELGR